ncbi:MAG: CoA-binding protein [Bacteroidota bacterium]
MDSSKRTLVIGASIKPERYANMAVKILIEHNIETLAIGLKNGFIGEVEIQTGLPVLDRIHTVTLYLGSDRQKPYYEYILSLKPKRIIFNPGTENPVLMQLATASGIETLEACTLVLLRTGNY